MGAGKLRHRVRIEQPITELGNKGQPVTTWRKYTNVRAAECIEGNGRELWMAQQLRPQVNVLVRMRWLKGVTSDMRLVWYDGDVERILHIDAPPPNPDGKKRMLHMQCVERRQ